jgi:putative serine protease PepD
MTVNIALASRAGTAYANATTPSVTYLGVQVATQPAQGATPAGALVQGIESGSPAESAGLATGDVITSIGTRPVTSVDGLSTALFLTPAYSSVQIAFIGTDGIASTTAATTGSYPSTEATPSVVAI